MTEHALDIMGKICPYCLLSVQKKLETLRSGDILKVKCDHPPAANDNIPFAMRKAGHRLERTQLEPGVWELVITKK